MADLVTKLDMEVMQQQFTSMRSELGLLREEANASKCALRHDIAATTREPQETKRDLQVSMLSLRHEMTALIANSELRVTVRLYSVMAAGIAMLAVLIKLSSAATASRTS